VRFLFKGRSEIYKSEECGYDIHELSGKNEDIKGQGAQRLKHPAQETG
jgi:hypothetical protein